MMLYTDEYFEDSADQALDWLRSMTNSLFNEENLRRDIPMREAVIALIEVAEVSIKQAKSIATTGERDDAL